MSTVSPATRHVVIGSPIGPLTGVRDDDGITGVYFPHHWTRPDPATFGPEVDAADDRGGAKGHERCRGSTSGRCDGAQKRENAGRRRARW